MRFTVAALLIAALLSSTAPSFALSPKKGAVVHGSYLASGTIGLPSLSLNYLQAKATVTSTGKVRGTVQRIVKTKKGVVLQRGTVKLRGKIQNVRQGNGRFTAPAVLRLSDGSKIVGSFRGLTGSGDRLSRFFRGKFAGIANSTFTLRSR